MDLELDTPPRRSRKSSNPTRSRKLATTMYNNTQGTRTRHGTGAFPTFTASPKGDALDYDQVRRAGRCTIRDTVVACTPNVLEPEALGYHSARQRALYVLRLAAEPRPATQGSFSMAYAVCNMRTSYLTIPDFQTRQNTARQRGRQLISRAYGLDAVDMRFVEHARTVFAA
ncbi:hypothetical protein EXIGLDRAFT_781923 [Exidia glandulosa HHB12029]|uniref:Uncharacterized protein n=1 Tax=Exidia glandulosa HHB12029 TaxID=1314781 RepID=A0A165B2X8_EXIGL|nr:hypothetical protein EXIGLDRAFT_781923 [Exidia glandulosa HHB12029]